jgi:hypothetical protein
LNRSIGFFEPFPQIVKIDIISIYIIIKPMVK